MVRKAIRGVVYLVIVGVAVIAGYAPYHMQLSV